MSRGLRQGTVSTRGKGACLGQASVVPPESDRGRGFQRRPLFLFYAYDFGCSTVVRSVAWLAVREGMST